jgi:archaellin
VAAIAAAVIIKTAEELEERAEAAGDDAEKMVRSSPMIMIAEGTVTSGNIDTVYLYIDLYGSEGVDMRNVVLHLVASPSSGNAKSADLTYNTVTPGTADSDNYGTEMIVDPLTQYDPTATPPRYILGDRARLKLTVTLTQSLATLPPDSTLEIWTHATTTANPRYDYFRTPSAYPNGGIVSLSA